jgi:predicted component of type VI protein secretion system
MNQEQIAAIRKNQAILACIAAGKSHDIFFSVALMRDQLGLIKEHGKIHKNLTNWILTEKGKMVLNFQI